MNLKYYLRGLGIGIIVTALIMGIAFSGKKETLSDSEIMERAKALGMTEETTLIADALPEEDSESVEAPEATTKAPTSVPTAASQPTEAAVTPAPAVTETPVPTITPQPAETPVPTVTPQPTKAPVPTMTPQPTKAPASAAAEESVEGNPDVITIQINSGDGSYAACIQLEEAGLVESATAFDRYLYDNGYDKRINVGTFEIPLDAQPEQIAKILARME